MKSTGVVAFLIGTNAGKADALVLVGRPAGCSERMRDCHMPHGNRLHKLMPTVAAAAVLGLLAFAGCKRATPSAPATPAATEPAPAFTTIKMATTTSTENSGLLAVLLPALKAATGIEVQVIAVGTGKAIKHGENGDVDVLLVHDPEAEEKFVAQGCGVARVAVMYNDFVIVGPPADPAGLKGGKDAAASVPPLSPAGSAGGPTMTKSLYITATRLTPKPRATNFSSASGS